MHVYKTSTCIAIASLHNQSLRQRDRVHHHQTKAGRPMRITGSNPVSHRRKEAQQRNNNATALLHNQSLRQRDRVHHHQTKAGRPMRITGSNPVSHRRKEAQQR